jgi:cobalt-zinc-cadmium efflux system outer membrane protein
MRIAHWILVSTMIVPAPEAQTAEAIPDWQKRLRDGIARAVAQNPDLGAMEARIQAAGWRVPQTTALPDPEIEIGVKDIPPGHPSFTRDDFTMQMIAARQRFPGFGKLSGEKRAAEAELASLKAEHLRHVVETASDVADSFFRLAELDRRIAISEATRRRLSDAVTSARERYRVGKGVQADVLRADLEKTAIDDRLASLQASRRAETARWNALQSLSPRNPVLSISIDGEVENRIVSAAIPSAEELLIRAEQSSPVVAMAQADLRHAEERVGLARLERRPDWMLMGYYGRRERFEDLAGLSVSFNLPWSHPRRLEERRAEREAELESARATLASVRNLLRRDIDQAYAELEKNREQSRFYRGSILPQAETNYRAAREAYAVGAIDFLTYVRAATDLDGYEAESAEREAGIGRALAMLQKAAGLPLIEGTPGLGGDHAEK